MVNDAADVHKWTTAHVAEWMQINGFHDYVDLFCTQMNVNGATLLHIDENDLSEPPYKLSVIGDIKRMGLALKVLRLQNTNCQLDCTTKGGNKTACQNSSIFQLISFDWLYKNQERMNETFETKNTFEEHFVSIHKKLILSFTIIIVVAISIAFAMVMAHDRLPDRDMYPPLPDLFLDNIPYVPWAFLSCEVVMMILCFTFVVLLFFHKYRLVPPYV